MILQNLHQPAYNATLMGVLIGALRHYGSPVSDAWAYGASGHAFVMNIHTELCPSGPYCWNRAGFNALARNLGVVITDLGYFDTGSAPDERRRVEAQLVAALDAGSPCALVNMEYQLICGYDDSGFITAPIWPAPHAMPAHLTYGTWSELGGEVHVNYLTLRRVDPAVERQAAVDSLRYAVDLYRNSARHTEEGYAVGAGAWDHYIGAVRNGYGASHGNWWNGVVWSECRAMAATWLEEVGVRFPIVRRDAVALAQDYRTVAEALGQASVKEMEAAPKIALLERAAALESECVGQLATLADTLETP